MDIFLFPPIVFAISLLFVLTLAHLISGWAPETKSDPLSGKNKPYACGEEFTAEKVIPDYQEFFPYAIFFTLLHVAGLMIATWSLNPMSMGVEYVLGYIASVAVILAILFLG